MALSSRRKKSVVSAGSRSTSLRGGLKVSLQAFSRQTGKRKVNELASSDDTMEPANRRPAPGAGSAPLPSIPLVRAMKLLLAASNSGHPREG